MLLRFLISETVARGTLTLLPWIDAKKSLLVCGPKSCGKKTLIKYLSSVLSKESSVTVVHTSAVYGTAELIDRLKRACSRLDSLSDGRTYQPKKASLLILLVEDVHRASRQLQVRIAATFSASLMLI